MNHAPNRHIVDQLADVRAEMKALKVKEDQLKAEVSDAMGNRDSLGGDQYVALQRITERKGAIDEKALKAAGIDADKFRKPAVTVYSIVTEVRAMEEVA